MLLDNQTLTSKGVECGLRGRCEIYKDGTT